MDVNRNRSQRESEPLNLSLDPVTGEYRYVPTGNARPALPPAKKSGPLRYIAAALAVCVISALSGGGAAYYIVNNYTPPALQDTPLPGGALPDSQGSTPNTVSPTGTESVANIVNRVSTSVVEILMQIETTNPFFGPQIDEGGGSGVILTQDGYIVTNNHVVEGASAFKVRVADGTEYDAALIGTDSRTDLAVIKIDATGLNPAKLADSSQIQVGETAIAIGNPLGTLGGTVTTGIISAKDREITIDNESMMLLQTSAAVNPGNSGGGLFNIRGELMGIVNAKSAGVNVEGLGFAIPSNIVSAVTADVIEKGYVSGRPELGIKVYEILDAQAAFFYRVNDFGVYVAATTRDNGLEVGDMLVRIDGVEIKSALDIRSALDKHSVGDTIELEIKRNGAPRKLSVTLAEQIPEDLKIPDIAA